MDSTGVATGKADKAAVFKDWWQDRLVAGQQLLDQATVGITKAKKNYKLRKEKAKANMLDISAPLRRKMLTNLREVMKTTTVADPDMWVCVSSLVQALIDQLWQDIEQEIERSLETALLAQHKEENVQGPKGGRLMNLWCSIRAFILHHYLPHDKSIFGKLKDPVYLLITLVTLLPIHGLRVAVFAVLLVMLIFPGPPDEFQLMNYILLFKGTQFLTSGFIALAMGAGQYYYCYNVDRDGIADCIDQIGPSSVNATGQAVDYLGSIVLVWAAFFLLQFSRSYAAETFLGRSNNDPEEEKSNKRKKGGRLRKLLRYDVVCFAISILFLVLATVFTQQGDEASVVSDAKFRQHVFWCRVFYSLCALPFTFFMIPVFLSVLTHCDYTGYNAQGACVEWVLPYEKNEAEQQESQSFSAVPANKASNAYRTWKAWAYKPISPDETVQPTAPPAPSTAAKIVQPPKEPTVSYARPIVGVDCDALRALAQPLLNVSAQCEEVQASQPAIPSLARPASEGTPSSSAAEGTEETTAPTSAHTSAQTSAQPAAQPSAQPSATQAPDLALPLNPQIKQLGDHVLGIVAKGRAARGDVEGRYKFGDFTRGLWTQVQQSGPASCTPTKAEEAVTIGAEIDFSGSSSKPPELQAAGSSADVSPPAHSVIGSQGSGSMKRWDEPAPANEFLEQPEHPVETTSVEELNQKRAPNAKSLFEAATTKTQLFSKLWKKTDANSSTATTVPAEATERAETPEMADQTSPVTPPRTHVVLEEQLLVEEPATGTTSSERPEPQQQESEGQHEHLSVHIQQDEEHSP